MAETNEVISFEQTPEGELRKEFCLPQQDDIPCHERTIPLYIKTREVRRYILYMIIKIFYRFNFKFNIYTYTENKDRILLVCHMLLVYLSIR